MMTTLHLFYEGKDIDAIACERRMTRNRIAEHIAELLQNGIIHNSELTADDRDLVEEILGV